MKVRVLSCLVLLVGFASSCGKRTEGPEDAFNGFLSAIDKQDCPGAFAFFSGASQQRIREDAARASKESPAYAAEFTPEKFYCTSVYASRFHEYNRGSGKPGKIEGTNAIIIATIRKGTGFALPGWSPFLWTNAPAEVRMVQENGAWKLDLLAPTTEEAKANAAREKALRKEREMMAAANQQLREQVYRRCTNFQLVAHWSFKAAPADGMLPDETRTYQAELLGARMLDLPEGGALQFQATGEALRLPEAVLNYRRCGVIAFWFRRDDAQSLNRVLLKVRPGVFSETGIEVHPDGRIHFNVQRNAITGSTPLETLKFYQLVFIWNENGMRIYVDGRLDATLERPAYTAANSTLTELGRDPNDPRATGSRMTIRDLKIYEGVPGEGDLAGLLR
jgi:hypothetical protein